MKNLSFWVSAIVIGLCFLGTVTNLSRKNSSLFLSSEYLLANHSTGHTPQTANTADISFCFFNVLFQSHVKPEWKIKHLSLSDNLISKATLSPFTHLHSLEILNLSNNTIRSLSLDLPLPHSSGRRKHHRASFCNGLPHLKVLILQRNQLSGVPKGLWKLKSLQTLDLSFNGILQIGLSDFQSCLNLENICLKSNKIFKIHPDAFKGLKKLQVVDLSSNVLTTLLPVVNMALEFPHLKLDLTDNQWQCEDSIADFQNFTSESWREKWNVICNSSVGNEEPYLETSKIRIPRDVGILPPTTLSHTQSKAERHQEGSDVRFSALGKAAWPGHDSLREMQPQWPTELRNPQNEQTTDRKVENSSNLTLAVCLSVLITFVVAFCLGAFARPDIDRLWQQRCLNKSPGSGNAHSNKGFCDETEATRSMQQHQGIGLHQASHHSNLHGNQNPSWAEGPHTIVISERALRNRMDPGSQQSSVQCGDNVGAGSRDYVMLQNHHTAHSTPHGHPNTDNHKLIPTVLEHTYDSLEESNYGTVAWEYSLHEDSRGGSSVAGPLETVSSSTPSKWDKLNLSHSRELEASLSKTLGYINVQGTGENEAKGWPEEPLETRAAQMERPVSNTISWLGTQQPRFQEASAEEGPSALYDEVPHDDPGDVDPQSLPPRWGSGSDVTVAAKVPGPRDVPFDPHYNLETIYESDSDEGSLFTLSSEGSEATRSLTEEQAPGEENGGANQTLHIRTSGECRNDVTSVENIEAITPERSLEKYETQEDHFGNTLISGPDSNLYEVHLECASDSSEPQNSLAWSRYPDHRPLQPETPDTFVYDYDTMLQSQAVDWHCSHRDLEFLNISLPSPAYSAEDPSDPEEEPATKEM